MNFLTYKFHLVEYTEDRTLVLSREAEAWACYLQKESVEKAGDMLLKIGVYRANNPRRNQS